MGRTTKFVLIIFITWAAALGLVALLGFQMLPHEFTHGKPDFFLALANWDGGHFLGIAENGYVHKLQYAFFPLYPLLISLVSKLLNISLLSSAITINLISDILSLIILLKLLKLDLPDDFAKKTILSLLIFPTSFYLLTAYSESLFLLFTVSCFYLTRLAQQKGLASLDGKQKLFLATIFAALACLTRLVGLAVVLALWDESYFSFKKSKFKWVVILAPLGFLIYCYFLLASTGDPFYFMVAEQNWQRVLVIPGINLIQSLQKIFTTDFYISNIVNFFDLLFFIFGVGMVLRGMRFLRHSYVVYSLAALTFPLFTSTLNSISRYLLLIFPIFILISMIKNKYLIFFYQLICILLLTTFVIFFINGYFVS